MHLTKAPMDLRRVYENVCAEVPDRDVMLTERSVAVREGEYWQVVVSESIVRGRYLLAGAQGQLDLSSPVETPCGCYDG